jgi:hypothetical protein
MIESVHTRLTLRRARHPEPIDEESDQASASPTITVALGNRGDRIGEGDHIAWADVGTHDPTLLLPLDEATSGRVHALARPTKRTGVSGRSSDRLGETAVHDRVTDEFVDPPVEHVRGLVSTEFVSQFGDSFEVDLHERGDQIVARGEMPVQSSDTDAGRAGDLVERRGNPVAPERVAGSSEKAIAVAAGVGPEVIHVVLNQLRETESPSV